MKRLTCALLAVCILLLGAAGCSGRESGEQEGITQINPQEGALSKKDKLAVNLYFADPSFTKLVSESRELDIPVNENEEYAVLQALCEGPASQGDVAGNRLINENTAIVSIASSGDVLFITLSRDFLDWSFFSGNNLENSLNQRKQLAVYSIVNTMVEVSGYSRVQLLVESEDGGTGQRIRLEDVGFPGSGVLEPLARNGEVVLNPKNTLRLLFEAVANQNYENVFTYISYEGETGDAKPDEEEFLAIARERNPVMEQYVIGDVIIGAGWDTAVIMVDITYKLKGEEQTEKTNIPVRLIKESGMWKMQYEEFVKLFFQGE